MKSRQLFAATSLGALSALALPAAISLPAADGPVPVPEGRVASAGLPRSRVRAAVTLRLEVDADGRPQDIRVLGGRDPAVVRRLTEAIAQWRFRPARMDGIAVGRRIELPLELIED